MNRQLIFLLTATLVIMLSHKAFATHQVQSWKDLKYKKVMRQKYDFSCGLSSLSTILTYHYNISVSEDELVNAWKMTHNFEEKVSFKDLAQLSYSFGVLAKGYYINFEKISILPLPVIVHLKGNKKNTYHFAVLDQVTEKLVHLKDPSLGNRWVTKLSFQKKFIDKNNTGKILLIFPQNR